MKNWDSLKADKNLILSKNFTPGRSGQKIDFIVVHHNAGDLTAEQIYQTWQARPASAHYQVTSNGIISQHVWDKDTAHHAGDLLANRRSIGIEHANDNTKTWTVAPKALEEGAHLVAALCVYYKLGRPQWGKNVYPHSHFSPTLCPGQLGKSQNAQYMARAQYWYDEMMRSKVSGGASGGGVGTSAPKPAPRPAPKPVVKPPEFPLPKGFYYGPRSGPMQSVSGMAYNQHAKNDVVKSRNGVYYSRGLQAWQQQMRNRGWSIMITGKYDEQTQTVARKFQRVAKLTVDSLIGPATWRAAWEVS